MNERIAAISVDLDEIPCYSEIHGIAAPEGPSAHAVYDRCLPRLKALFTEHEVPATFFAIGRDLERSQNRQAIDSLCQSGHEIANHSFHHHYDLTRRPTDEMRSEVERGIQAIEQACGTRPVGFRAPGYTVTDALIDVLESLDVTYDSSVFPCPTYYAAKVAARGWMALRGRTSRSVIDSPVVLRASRFPYRMGRPYWQRGEGLVELPIGVTRWGLPYIGTSIVAGGAASARALTRQMLGAPFVNLELHGIDVADAAEDNLQALSAVQPDLRRTGVEKMDVLAETLETLSNTGYRFVLLRDVASHVMA